MPLPPPPPGFTLDTPGASPGRPVIRKGAEPVKPDLPQGYGITNGTAAPVPGLPTAITTPESYRPITPEERQSFGVDPHKPFVVNIKTGKPELISQGKEDESSTPASDPDRVFQNDQLLKGIAHIRGLAQQPMALGGLPSTGIFQHIPLIGQNAADMAGALDQIKGDILRDVLAQSKQASPNGASGFGNLSNVEGESLKASIAHLSQAQSPEEFAAGLDQAEQFYKRALARSYGLDPMDPETAGRFGIALPEGQSAIKGAGEHITASNPLPKVDVGPQMGLSSEEKFGVNEQLKAIGPQLVKYLSSKNVSDAMILGFMQKNGVDPSTTTIMKVLKDRHDPKHNGGFQVDPYYNKPLKGREKTRAERSSGLVGSSAEAAADTGTLGLLPEFAGAVGALDGQGYSAARADFKGKQDALAFSHPYATLGGNVLGALSTVPLGVAKTLPGLMAQSGGASAAHGFLSSDDPSFGGRLENAAGEGAVGLVAPAVLNPVARGIGVGATRIARGVRSVAGADAGQLADEAAQDALAAHIPLQDAGAMRGKAVAQSNLGIEPTGVSTLDRPGQDFIARQVNKTPGARAAVDEAATKAEGDLPGQLRDDFTQAIESAAADGNTAKFLDRPAREIAADIQAIAGREFEAGIEPIKNSPLQVDEGLAEALSHERIKGAISDVLSDHKISTETRQALRSLSPALRNMEAGATIAAPPGLGEKAAAQIADMQKQIRSQALTDIPLTVDAARNLATALDRRAARMQDGSEGEMALGDLSREIRQSIIDQYPEYQPVNARYASRKRAIGALSDARANFLKPGEGTDNLAKATGRHSAEPGEPEFGDNVTESAGFTVTRKPQNLPSEKDMARAGAREAVTDKAGEGNAVAADLNTPNQRVRNKMVLGDQAESVEAKAKARTSNLELLKRIQSGGSTDSSGGRLAAGVKAAANAAFHRGGAMIASGLSGIRGVSAQDAERIARLYTQPGKADELIGFLEKRYGQRKARFVINRMGALTAAANSRRRLPAEAVSDE
jgi:hypothetical protein